MFYSQLLLIRDSKFRTTRFLHAIIGRGLLFCWTVWQWIWTHKDHLSFSYRERISTRWIHRKWALNYIAIPFTKNRRHNLMLIIFSTEKIRHFRVFSRRQKTKACDDLFEIMRRTMISRFRLEKSSNLSFYIPFSKY